MLLGEKCGRERWMLIIYSVMLAEHTRGGKSRSATAMQNPISTQEGRASDDPKKAQLN